jgi:hypothetical protein
MPFTVHRHPTGGYVIAGPGRAPLPAIFDSRAQAQDAADYLSTRHPRPWSTKQPVPLARAASLQPDAASPYAPPSQSKPGPLSGPVD